METMICRDCGEEKPLAKFQPNRLSNGRYPRCRKCPAPRPRVGWSQYSDKEKAERQKRYSAEYALKRYYGLSQADYDLILEGQSGGCAICHRPAGYDGKRLAVDHDHTCCKGTKTCGKCIRGLLCSSCNVGIGLLEENVGSLEEAIRYLKQEPDASNYLRLGATASGRSM